MRETTKKTGLSISISIRYQDFLDNIDSLLKNDDIVRLVAADNRGYGANRSTLIQWVIDKVSKNPKILFYSE